MPCTEGVWVSIGRARFDCETCIEIGGHLKTSCIMCELGVQGGEPGINVSYRGTGWPSWYKVLGRVRWRT